MDLIADKADKQVVVKIDVTAGKMGNLLELMEQACPTGNAYNRFTSMLVRPEAWPEILERGAGKSDRGPLVFYCFMDRTCRRYLDILVNKLTGQYEIARNDFRVDELAELELVVWRDKVD